MIKTQNKMNRKIINIALPQIEGIELKSAIVDLKKGVITVEYRQEDLYLTVKRGDFLTCLSDPSKTVIFNTAIPSFGKTEIFTIMYSLPILINGKIARTPLGTKFPFSNFRHSTEEEKQLMIKEMAKDGKRWNAEKKCIEDIPKPKFKVGDKVRLKDGISSKMHNGAASGFTCAMNEFIGRELTVKEYTHDGFVIFNEGYPKFNFHENWLEPWSDKPKKGDLAIFWDYDNKSDAIIKIYDRKDHKYYYDSSDVWWKNAIKFESKEQYEKLLRGEI